MLDDAEIAELARLEGVVVANDADGTSDGRWRAAYALFEIGDIVARDKGTDAALSLYEEVVSRTAQLTGDGPRALRFNALSLIADGHELRGRARESREIAEALVDEGLLHTPAEAVGFIVDAALSVAESLTGEGEAKAALSLCERVLGEFGGADLPGHRVTRARVGMGIAWTLGESGRLEESVEAYGRVIAEHNADEAPQLREILALASPAHDRPSTV